MKKINCDICGKDITEEYDEYDNSVLSFDERTTMELCDKCCEKYYKVRDKCNTKYYKLRNKYNNKIEIEMKKFYDKEIEKIEEK